MERYSLHDSMVWGFWNASRHQTGASSCFAIKTAPPSAKASWELYSNDNATLAANFAGNCAAKIFATQFDNIGVGRQPGRLKRDMASTANSLEFPISNEFKCVYVLL